MFTPEVSIIIPVYNGSRYLREAIDSALGQTYQNIEVIVVNDGSNDGGKTEELARSYGDKIQYISKENGGVASALNTGISSMRGEYFSWLSHDDVFKPDKTAKQLQYLEKWPGGKTIVYSDFAWIDEHSAKTGVFNVHSELAANKYLAILSTVLHGCTLLIPKSCFDEVGLFNEKLKTTQDNEMWIRLAKAGYSFVHMPSVLINSRQHAEQGQRLLEEVNKKETKDFYLWAIGVISGELGDSGLKAADILAGLGQKEACEELLKTCIQPYGWHSLIKRYYIKTRLLFHGLAR